MNWLALLVQVLKGRSRDAYFDTSIEKKVFIVSTASKPSFERFEFRDFQRERYLEVRKAFLESMEAVLEVDQALQRNQGVDVSKTRDVVDRAKLAQRLMEQQLTLLESIRNRVARDANGTSDPGLRAQRVQDGEQMNGICRALEQQLVDFATYLGKAERALRPKRA